jgi:peptide/nickel transport system ATP-binding protein
MEENLLEVRHITKIFSSGFLSKQNLVAVDDLSMRVPAGKPLTITVAGESGSGKTTLAQMVLGFLHPSSGEILFRGKDIYKLSGKDFTEYRRQFQAVFQNPYDVFNPFYRVDHVFEAAIQHFHLASSKAEGDKIVQDALTAVRLVPSETIGRYPHQLSGGQLQRVMIARALLLKPQVIIADEPVSMIDVSLRAIILDIMVSLKQDYGISFLYITHDLSTALQISDEILIMYKGSVVESGEAASVIQNPKHPYTQLLVQSIPIPDPEQKWSGSLELSSKMEVAGQVAAGCKFYDRCPSAFELCKSAQPALFDVGLNQKAACYLYRK